jgi:16S rRNA (guanine966-N2)-methyltransferase
MSRPPVKPMGAVAPGMVRIVGGRWRGSKLPVSQREGLRPTADRVRETVFNWLQPVLPGARVLDLFAGSGALGLEALSRGAHAATLIERDRDLAASLRATLERLRRGDPPELACDPEVIQADALRWLAGVPADGAIANKRRYDLVFLDPPFSDDLWRPVLRALPPWLADEAWLYVETPRLQAPHVQTTYEAGIAPDGHWRLHREGSTRDVRYALYRRSRAAIGGSAREE